MYIAAMSKVFLFVEIDVQEGKVEAFLEELQGHAQGIRSEDGCESLEIYRNSDNENVVNVWEIWSNRTAWDAHMANGASKAWREIASNYVLGEEITVMSKA
jgi:quinol monooxygenase YgiN